MAELEGKKFGPYDVLRFLGSGGMADAYLAHKQGLAGFDRFVVLKVLLRDRSADPTFVKMFADEAKLSNYIKHTNVVRIEDFLEYDGRYALVMEYVPGLPLVDLMDQLHSMERVMAPVLAASIVAQVLDGLHAAHHANDVFGRHLRVVHRDVSPPNVLISLAGDVRLIDFGIAKAQTQQVKTSVGIIKGKLRYMAPEQILGKRVGPWTDIYGVSAMLWEMLTMRPLFSDRKKAELLQSLNQEIEPPSKVCAGIPSAVDNLVLKGLALDPQQRFQDAHQMRDALVRAVPEVNEISNATVGEFLRAVLPDKTRMIAEVLSGHAVIGASSGKLVILNGNQKGQTLALDSNKDSWKVGRSLECDLTIDDGDASREHFCVQREPNGLRAFDLGSKNGLQVNGSKVSECWLDGGDELCAGQTYFQFVAHTSHADQDSQQRRSIAELTRAR